MRSRYTVPQQTMDAVCQRVQATPYSICRSSLAAIAARFDFPAGTVLSVWSVNFFFAIAALSWQPLPPRRRLFGPIFSLLDSRPICDARSTARALRCLRSARTVPRSPYDGPAGLPTCRPAERRRRRITCLTRRRAERKSRQLAVKHRTRPATPMQCAFATSDSFGRPPHHGEALHGLQSAGISRYTGSHDQRIS